jgi:hypothetical protein
VIGEMGRRREVIKRNCEPGVWYMPVIPALRRVKQKDQELEASLGYRVKACVKKKQQEREIMRFNPQHRERLLRMIEI